MARVIFNEDRCKGCKLCTAVCPKKIVIILEDKLNQKVSIQLVSRNGQVYRMCFCATVCPDCVIEVYK